MPDKSLKIWQVALIESHLTKPTTAEKIAAIRPAYTHGFTVDEIAALTNFPEWRVRQVLLGDATNRTTDD